MNPQVADDDRGPFVRVFLASPSGLEDERKAAARAVARAGTFYAESDIAFQLLRWEDMGPDDVRPQERINRAVRRCNVFVAMLWKTWGSETGEFDSGFEEEWHLATERRRQGPSPSIWPYFKHVSRKELESPVEGLRRVLDFQAELEDNNEFFYKRFDDDAELERLLYDRLLKHANERLRTQPPSSEQTATLPPDVQEGARRAETEIVDEPDAASAPESEKVEPDPLKSGIGPSQEDESAEALWGPLLAGDAWDRLEVNEYERRVSQLVADNDFGSAAGLLDELADLCETEGVPVLGELYRRRAVGLHIQAGDTAQAVADLRWLIEASLKRGSDLARVDIRRLEQVLEPTQLAIARAYAAEADWPEHPEFAWRALEAALEGAS